MKDRIYMVLAFLGFILLAVVTISNYDIDQDEKVFAVGDFYTPQTVRSRVDSSVELYAQMSGDRGRGCPQSSMQKVIGSVKNIESLNSSNERNKYGATCMFVPCSVMVNGASSNVEINPSFTSGKDPDSVRSQLNAKCSLVGTDSLMLGDLWNIDGDTYVELVAPFNFTFGNINTTDNDTIIITNTLGNCRITFSGVANWFCAGTPGTSWLTGSGTANNLTAWEDHGKQTRGADGSNINAAHLTIVGKTSNSQINGGTVKDVVGYGTADTSVYIEVYGNNSWEPMSIYEFITNVRSN